MRKLLVALATGLVLSFAAVAQNPAIDLNHADAATLARVLTGVGPAKAEAIIAYREAHGPFQHIDELVKVKGIGPATIEQNRAVMVVQAGPAAAAAATSPAVPASTTGAITTRPTDPNR